MKVVDKLPDTIRVKILCKKPIEIRPVNPINSFSPEVREPVKYVWFRAIEKMPDDPAVHQYLRACASDFNLVLTSLYPHGHSVWESKMQVAGIREGDIIIEVNRQDIANTSFLRS